ncbi:hypothetical protein [Kitasatospora xanthocidica]|uniref:hypothetical protein n=1 Tax=Kitasatospora xanthocidica TaxID=83382 RepID=UPI0015F2FEFD|nr:hypothetical protein [Kitasatospora xanthocidica]
MEWINPRFVDLVAWWRQEQAVPDPDADVYGPTWRADSESMSARRGFLMEPLAGK